MASKAELFGNMYFNPEVYLGYRETIPDTKLNALLQSGVLRLTNEFDATFTEQGGTKAMTRSYSCPLTGTSQNYDGATDLVDKSQDSYLQTVHSYGRAGSWSEKDFTSEIASEDFVAMLAMKQAKYWQDDRQTTLISILKGLEGVSNFKETHVIDTEAAVTATTLNSALSAANGDARKLYKVVIAPSEIVTALENANLLDFLKQTDKAGIQKDLTIAQWNGKMVIEDDDCPTVVTAPTETEDGYTTYTLYALAYGAIDYDPLPVAHPVSTERDETTSGGISRLVERNRAVLAPQGFSYIGTQTSPLNTDFEDSDNWEVIKNSDGTKFYPTKAFPFTIIKVRITDEGTATA